MRPFSLSQKYNNYIENYIDFKKWICYNSYKGENDMQYKIVEKINKNFKISKKIHSVFFEYFGRVIYDGIWVGKDSAIPNIDGIRKDVVDACKELDLGAMRWPGGCCADHYHWKNGIGKERFNRVHPMPDSANPVWRNDFGTDEFMKFCALTGAEPILTINTATGTPEEFLDWNEYVNGSVDTKYGKMRAENGHPEPYNVKYWGVGNTDENVWHIDYNNPVAYAQTYLRYQTVVREARRKQYYFIGLGLSMRHKLPGWTGKALDHITRNQKDIAPNALSVHHYLGGMKQGGELCGTDIDYTDEGYYALLNLLERYQYDIDLHRVTIREHTRAQDNVKICFDEWGVWHTNATFDACQNQKQTMRDAIFAGLTFHIFYRNCDIVEFAMETQLSNLLQSLFETDGEKFYKTPTFYVMKLFKEHSGQYLIPMLPDDIDEDLDAVSSVSEDGNRLTVTVVNRHLYDEKTLDLSSAFEGRKLVKSDIITAKNVRDYNTFDEPNSIVDKPFAINNAKEVAVPPHSIIRLVLEK